MDCDSLEFNPSRYPLFKNDQQQQTKLGAINTITREWITSRSRNGSDLARHLAAKHRTGGTCEHENCTAVFSDFFRVVNSGHVRDSGFPRRTTPANRPEGWGLVWVGLDCWRCLHAIQPFPHLGPSFRPALPPSCAAPPQFHICTLVLWCPESRPAIRQHDRKLLTLYCQLKRLDGPSREATEVDPLRQRLQNNKLHQLLCNIVRKIKYTYRVNKSNFLRDFEYSVFIRAVFFPYPIGKMQDTLRLSHTLLIAIRYSR